MHLWGWDRRKGQKEHLLLTASGGLKALTISICILNFIKWVEHRSLWINVETTFIRRLKIKQYPTSDFQICTKLIQHQCPTLTQRWINVAEHWYKSSSTLRNIVSCCFKVDITLCQRCFNLASTLVTAISKPIRLIKSMELQSYSFSHSSFILLNEKICLCLLFNCY